MGEESCSKALGKSRDPRRVESAEGVVEKKQNWGFKSEKGGAYTLNTLWMGYKATRAQRASPDRHQKKSR